MMWGEGVKVGPLVGCCPSKALGSGRPSHRPSDTVISAHRKPAVGARAPVTAGPDSVLRPDGAEGSGRSRPGETATRANRSVRWAVVKKCCRPEGVRCESGPGLGIAVHPLLSPCNGCLGSVGPMSWRGWRLPSPPSGGDKNQIYYLTLVPCGLVLVGGAGYVLVKRQQKKKKLCAWHETKILKWVKDQVGSCGCRL